LSVLSCLIYPACSLLFVPFCLLSPVFSWPFCCVTNLNSQFSLLFLVFLILLSSWRPVCPVSP
jgi:hypothetical protein